MTTIFEYQSIILFISPANDNATIYHLGSEEVQSDLFIAWMAVV